MINRFFKTAIATLLLVVTSLSSQIPIMASEINRTSNQSIQKATSNSDVEEMLSLVNQERYKNGLSLLTLDDELQACAQIRAQELCILYAHQRPNGEQGYTISDKVHSENIGNGYWSVQSVFNAWMNSTSHRNAILDPDYKSFGTGHYIQSENGQFMNYWTQLFSYEESNSENINNFVTRLYNVFLDRQPDPQGLEHYKGHLINHTKSASNVLADFIFSIEFSNRQFSNEQIIEKFYQGFFGRASDSHGFIFWKNNMDNGMNVASLSNGFMESQEYRNMCKSYNIEP